MKKLLLVSLLAMGATSFAAVSGTATSAEMPIKVKGMVMAKTGAELVIEPVKNAGVEGASMEFDFREVVQGNSQSLEGTFKIYRANKSIMENTKIGILNAAGTGVDTTAQTKLDTDKITIDYTVTSSIDAAKKEILGTLGVNVAVAEEATTGAFIDTNKKLAVFIETPAEA